MKKIIIKTIIAVLLGVLMAMDTEVPFWMVIFFTFLAYSALSWFGMIFYSLYAFGGVLRCIISLLGSVVIFAVPSMLLEALLPDSWIRTSLTAIGFIILFIIPFVRDWKKFKVERMQIGEGIKVNEDERG